jgi:hypothetical protein
MQSKLTILAYLHQSYKHVHKFVQFIKYIDGNMVITIGWVGGGISLFIFSSITWRSLILIGRELNGY